MADSSNLHPVDFWGWLTAEGQNVEPVAGSTVTIGSGGEWLHGPWAPLSLTCATPPADMAFELLTSSAAPPAVMDADFDLDQDVDGDDFSFFDFCASGPAVPITDSCCQPADFDVDGDVDLLDFAEFQLQFTGP
jgi:hypothetical protein